MLFASFLLNIPEIFLKPQMYLNNEPAYRYEPLIHNIFEYQIPVLLLIIFNSLIYKKIRILSRSAGNDSRSQR